jgi:release factor glutamine methyltransferase
MRNFSAYELNHLIKFGFDPFKTSQEIPNDMPVEYFTGFASFRDLTFKVNKSTLIPRIETEEIIDIALKLVNDMNHRGKVTFADVGTGCGAIGITFAKELVKRSIIIDAYLSDISEDALEVARFNLESVLFDKKVNCFTYNNQADSIKIIKSNLLNGYPKKKFDIIFANLPYIPSSRINDLDSSVKDFEPHLALDGGKDGLTLIRVLLHDAKEYLVSKGYIVLEVDDTHFDTSEFEKEWEIEVKKDLNDKFRFWVCTSKA